MAPFRMQTTSTYSIGARRQLFDVGFDPNQYNMTGIDPLPILDDDEQDNCSPPIENVCHDDNVCLEPDESDYDSDCSLGSLNSLYLNIKKNSKLKTPFLNQNNDLNKTYRFSKNIDTKTQVSRKKPLKIMNAESTKKLNTISFYGKQKSVTRHLYSRQSYVSKLKNKHSNIRKTTYLVRKSKPYFNKLCISLINRKQRQNLKINNLIRYQLKEPIPLMKFSPKVRKNIPQNSEEFSLTNSIEKSSRQNKIDFLTQCKNILMRENIKKKPESTPLLMHEYSDTDDFENTDVVNGVIDRLNDEDNTFTDSDNNGQWDINEHVDVCEGNVTYTLL